MSGLLPCLLRFRSFLPVAVLLISVTVPARAQNPAPPAPAAPSASVLPELANDKPYVPPKVLQRVPVPYPELAHLNRAQGVVRVRFSIDENGDVSKAVCTKSSGSVMLDTVVRDPNLLRWKFTPASFDGKPVPSTKDVEFEFRLDPAEERALAIKRLALPVGTPDAPYPKVAFKPEPRGSVTIAVRWTRRGLVDMIYVAKSSGSSVLDRAAARWAYENWRIDPATITDKNKNDEFTKVMNFEPPP